MATRLKAPAIRGERHVSLSRSRRMTAYARPPDARSLFCQDQTLHYAIGSRAGPWNDNPVPKVIFCSAEQANIVRRYSAG